MTYIPPKLIYSLSVLPEFTFRRVLLKGKILYPPILLGPRVEEGVPGWDLIQPLSRSPPPGSLSPAQIFSSEIENPSTILLNRGFIPNPQAASIRAGHEPPPNVGEEIVVEGYLSKLIGQGWSPENMPERGEWFWKDVQRMADWCGGEAKGVQPVLVDVIDRESSAWACDHLSTSYWPLVDSRKASGLDSDTGPSNHAMSSLCLIDTTRVTCR